MEWRKHFLKNMGKEGDNKQAEENEKWEHNA